MATCHAAPTGRSLIDGDILDPNEMDAWKSLYKQANALLEDSIVADNDVDREQVPCSATRFRSGEQHRAPARIDEDGHRLRRSIDRNPEILRLLREILDREFPNWCRVCNIGDAHVHVNMLPKDESESERAKCLMIDFARKAVSLGGTVGAERRSGKTQSPPPADSLLPAK